MDDPYMNDANNVAIVRLATLLQQFPELSEVIEAPVGEKFRRKGDRFVPDI